MIVLAVLGAALVAAGLAGLGYCILAGFRMRRARLAGTEAMARLRQLALLNAASVAGAALGLALITAYFLLR